MRTSYGAAAGDTAVISEDASGAWATAETDRTPVPLSACPCITASGAATAIMSPLDRTAPVPPEELLRVAVTILRDKPDSDRSASIVSYRLCEIGDVCCASGYCVHGADDRPLMTRCELQDDPDCELGRRPR